MTELDTNARTTGNAAVAALRRALETPSTASSGSRRNWCKWRNAWEKPKPRPMNSARRS